MSQKRKKRIIVFEIRIICFTDFIQEFISKAVNVCLMGIKMNEENQGRSTIFEINERVLDGKTFGPFEKQNGQ